MRRGQMTPDPAALTAALDRTAIAEVINRYFFAADVGDIELVVSCFTDDAVVRLMDGNSVMRGREEVRDEAVADTGRVGADERDEPPQEAGEAVHR